MKKWQEERNYKKIMKPDGTVINIITVEGQDVEVTDEIFTVYSQMDRQERYQEEQQEGIVLSLERFAEDNMLLEFLTSDYVLSAEDMVLAAEDAIEREKLLQQLPSVLEQLTKSKRQLIHTLYFENVSLRKYAARTGVRHRAIQKRRDHILSKLRIYFLF